MERNVGAAARLSQSDRAELAIAALARSEPISDLAVQHGVSRKFVRQQANKARYGVVQNGVTRVAGLTLPGLRMPP